MRKDRRKRSKGEERRIDDEWRKVEEMRLQEEKRAEKK